MLQHIDWSNDCMTIIFGHTKTDQTGEKSESSIKHVYANPQNPVICPILSMAVFAFCKSRRTLERC